jgi:transposase-like protein
LKLAAVSSRPAGSTSRRIKPTSTRVTVDGWINPALIEAELTSEIVAAPNQRTPERLTQRNGHRPV